MFRRLLVVSVLLSSLAWACSEDPTAPQVAPEEGPRAPSGLLIDETSPSSVTVSWIDLSTDETGFRVERSRVGEEFALVDTADANATEFTDTTVEANQVYLYRVRSNRLEAESEPSGSAQVNTVANTAPSVPFDPSPVDRVQDLEPAQSIVLDWTGEDADADVLSYDLFFGNSRQELEEVAAGLTETQFTMSQTFAANRSFFWWDGVHEDLRAARRRRVWDLSEKFEKGKKRRS